MKGFGPDTTRVLLELWVWLLVILFSALGVIGNLALYELGKKGQEAVASRFPRIDPTRWKQAGELFETRRSWILLLSSLPARLEKLASFGAERWQRAVKFGTDTRRYMVITTYVGAVTGFGNAVLLLVLGVDFAVLWGVVAFLLSHIPVVGFWLALIPPFVLALLEFGLPTALLVLLGFGLINGSAENIVKPKLMGEGLDLAPSVVFLSLIFWTAILGPQGAILALPMTMAVKQLLLQADEQNRWVAALISSVGPREIDANGGQNSNEAHQAN